MVNNQRSIARKIMPFLCCYITHPDEAAARRMAEHLLTERLIACANIFPVTSAYWWQGAVQQENEWVSLVKTSLELEAALESAVQRMHSYEVPCIMRFEARANETYEQWIAASVKKEQQR
jgi:periplasmic divalent cation tolerance protein